MGDLDMRARTHAAKRARWRLLLATLMFVGYFFAVHASSSRFTVQDGDFKAQFWLVLAAGFFLCTVLVGLGSRLGWLLGLLATLAAVTLLTFTEIRLVLAANPDGLVLSFWIVLHLAFFVWVSRGLMSSECTSVFGSWRRGRTEWVEEAEAEAPSVASLFVWPENFVPGRTAESAAPAAVAVADPPDDAPPPPRRHKAAEPLPPWGHFVRRAGIVLTLAVGATFGTLTYNGGWLDRVAAAGTAEAPASVSADVRLLELSDMPGFAVRTVPTSSLFYGQCRADTVLRSHHHEAATVAFGRRSGGGDVEFVFESLFHVGDAPEVYRRVVAHGYGCKREDAARDRNNGALAMPAHIVPAVGPALGDRATWWENTKADPPPAASLQIMPGQSLSRDPSRPRWLGLILVGHTILQVEAPTQPEAVQIAETALSR